MPPSFKEVYFRNFISFLLFFVFLLRYEYNKYGTIYEKSALHIILEAVYSENYSKFAMEFEYKCFSVR